MGKIKDEFDAMYEGAYSGGRSGIQFSNWLPASNMDLGRVNGTTFRLVDINKDADPELVKYGHAYARWANNTAESHTEFNEDLMKQYLDKD